MLGRLLLRPLARVRDRLRGRHRVSASTRDALAVARAARAQCPGDRRFVALQLRSFDRGGLEEVVLTLASGLRDHDGLLPVVFDVAGQGGHLAALASAAGILTIPLHDDPELLEAVLDQLQPAVVNLHYDVFGAAIYRRRGIPVVYTIHNTYVWATPEFITERRPVYAGVDRFIAVSPAVADFFATRFGVPRERIDVIANGLALANLQHSQPMPRSDLGIAPATTLFVNVASFNWNKFQVLLLAAMARLRTIGAGAHLLLVGNVHDQACHEFVQAEIDRLALRDHVTVLDYVPKDRVMGLLQTADCFVLPSLLEGCSMAALEAAWAGLPLILSDVGAARLLVRDGDVGHVIPNACPDLQQLTTHAIVEEFNRGRRMPNLDALVAAMSDLVMHRAAWRARAASGRQRIESEFGAEVMCQRYAALFDTAMRTRS